MDLQKSRVACVGMLAATVSFAVAKESPLSLPPGVKEKINALVRSPNSSRLPAFFCCSKRKNSRLTTSSPSTCRSTSTATSSPCAKC